MRVVGEAADLELAGWEGGGAEASALVLGDDRRQKTEDRGFVIGPAGANLWRRMPWPVRDSVFDLEPPKDPAAVLVVGDESVADGLRDNGAAVESADRLTLAGLRAAGIVVLLGGHGALPAPAMAVPAARRVLVADATEVTFGLQDGIEFLAAASPEQAVARADVARVHPAAVHSLRVMGARAARDHAASAVYPRLAADLP